MKLREALEAAEASPLGTKMAVSVPNSDLIAIQHAGDEIEIRRVAHPHRTPAGDPVTLGEWYDGSRDYWTWRPA